VRREFAEKSVDQTEKAISSSMDSASRSVAMVPGPMTDVAKHALAIAEAKASFDHARKLLNAKDVNEVMQLNLSSCVPSLEPQQNSSSR
jgi:hypothetical protein